MTVLAILQARMSSRRLPGKVLEPILGRPMIARQIERVGRAATIDRLVVATSRESSDDAIVAVCDSIGIACHRGDLDDVLGRFVGAVEAFGPADHVVRLTADCPLADPDVIDACLGLHLASGAEYTSNAIRRTYPDGLDVEVLTAAALARADGDTTDPAAREHVTSLVHADPTRFRVAHLEQEPDLGDLRWTVDDAEDLTFVRAVYGALFPIDPAFTSADVLALPFGYRRDPRSGGQPA